MLGAVNRVAAVDDVAGMVSGTWSSSVYELPANVDAVVSTDGAGGRVSRASLAKHLAASGDHSQTLPDLRTVRWTVEHKQYENINKMRWTFHSMTHHANNGAGGHVLHKAGEERLLGEISIVLGQMLLGSL